MVGGTSLAWKTNKHQLRPNGGTLGKIALPDATRGDYSSINPWEGGQRMANGLFRGLLVGALVGATAALLLAPSEGKVTRGIVREMGNGYVGTLREKIRRDPASVTSSENSG